jgi:hypothetical protein
MEYGPADVRLVVRKLYIQADTRVPCLRDPGFVMKICCRLTVLPYLLADVTTVARDFRRRVGEVRGGEGLNLAIVLL